jgi:hypothetical protein
MWWVISAVGIAALKLFFSRGRNAVWGGATLGALVGLALVLIRPGHDLDVVGRGIVIGAAAGLIAEFLGLIGDRLKRGSQSP